MKALFAVAIFASVFACKPEKKQRTKSGNTQADRPSGSYYDPACTGSSCTGSSYTNRGTAPIFQITKNGVNDGSYPTTLVAGRGSRVYWGFEVVGRSSTATTGYSTPTTSGSYKARVKNGYVIPGINIRKEGGNKFVADVYTNSVGSGSIQLEAIDINACQASGKYGSQCTDDYTFPSEMVHNLTIPYTVIDGLKTTTNTATCAIIDASGNLINGLDGASDGIYDAIVNLGKTIIGRNNDCY